LRDLTANAKRLADAEIVGAGEGSGAAFGLAGTDRRH